MKRFLAFLMLSLFALPAMAQGPWYAKGEFNGWSTDNLMTQDPSNSIHWSTTVGGLFANTTFEYKLATADWSQSAPGGNGKVTSNDDGAGNGAITFNMWDQQTWNDGWFPNNQRRVGYSDPLQYGWELMGSFDGFSTGMPLVNMGNGLYSVQASFPAGIYDYKFRKAGDWNVNMGNSFANGSANNQFAVLGNGDVWQFDLDLPNGRFRAVSNTQHGDFNADGNADASDYVLWRKNNPGNAAKYTEWRNNFGRTATWLAHGSFGADVTLTDQGGGNYGTTLSGLTAGQSYDVQVLRSDGGAQFPGSLAKVAADASGAINLHFYKLQTPTWNDGWNPSNASRFGYDDPHQYGWEIVGAFNGWPGANDPAYMLIDQGNGLYKGSFVMPTAGSYDFKFRHLDASNPWSTSIGDDFGNSAGNNSFTVAAGGDTWNFELDLTHGKWRAYHPASGLNAGQVPEPASLALAMLGLAFMGLIRRR
jgi:hypothetical protein